MRRIENIRSAKMERTIDNVAATMSFENITLTKENINDGRKILQGKISADEVCANLVKKYTEK